MINLVKRLKKITLAYRKIPDKKPYIEFITAALSIPVLITVIMINVNNLNSQNNKNSKDEPTVAPKTIYVPISGGNAQTQEKKNNNTSSPQSKIVISQSIQPCLPEVGNISISSPKEGETVSSQPLAININYQKANYCAVVWSYRINGGNWSDYDDKSIALYNLPDGKIKLELRVKSIVSGEEKTLTRDFQYEKDDSSSVIIPDGQDSGTISAH